MPTSVLVLAGSAEAAALVHRLVGYEDLAVEASFAGRVRDLGQLPVPIRVGGFGGAEGLAAALREAGVDLLVDATHPFAAQMQANAAAAAAATGVPRLRLARPPWTPGPGDRWHEVEDLEAAAAALGALGARRPFLALGRHPLTAFAGLDGARLLLRAIDPPEDPAPVGTTLDVVLGRGPFAEADELALLRDEGVDVVVTRNSGGDGAAAKLTAARTLGLPVVVVRGPTPPAGDTVPTVDEAVAWVLAHRTRPVR